MRESTSETLRAIRYPGDDGPDPRPLPPRPTPKPGMRDGTLLRDPAGVFYLIQAGQRRRVPNIQTLFLSGKTPAAAAAVSQADLNSIPAGAQLPTFPYVVAEAKYRSSGGGHIAVGHASLNLNTGLVTGTVTTTNYVQLTGYHSGTLLVPRNEAGDPVVANLPGMFRFGVGARVLGDPVTRTDVIGFQLDPAAARRVCHFDIIVTENPDNLKQILAKLDAIGNTAKGWSWVFGALGSSATHATGTGSTRQ